MKKLIIGVVIAIVLIFVILISTEDKVESLNAPEIQKLSEEVSSNVHIRGVAYPFSQILVYLDNNFIKTLEVDGSGNFAGDLNFKEEGSHVLAVKQSYRNVVSPLSQNQEFTVDLTPPSTSQFKIETQFPLSSKVKFLDIVGKGPAGDYVNLNGTRYEINEKGVFVINHPLIEGKNILSFKLQDKLGNLSDEVYSKTIEIDSIAPKISTFLCSNLNKVVTITSQEEVCLSTGQWESWEDPAPIPITGHAIGDFKSITVNGTLIKPDEKGEIFQRVRLPVPKGLNKYKVIAIDKFGNSSFDYLEMTVQSIKNSYQDDVLDRLDDIESQIDDLEY